MYYGNRNQKMIVLSVRVDGAGSIDKKGTKETSWAGRNVLFVLLGGGYMGLLKTLDMCFN